MRQLQTYFTVFLLGLSGIAPRVFADSARVEGKVKEVLKDAVRAGIDVWLEQREQRRAARGNKGTAGEVGMDAGQGHGRMSFPERFKNKLAPDTLLKLQSVLEDLPDKLTGKIHAQVEKYMGGTKDALKELGLKSAEKVGEKVGEQLVKNKRVRRAFFAVRIVCIVMSLYLLVVTVWLLMLLKNIRRCNRKIHRVLTRMHRPATD